MADIVNAITPSFVDRHWWREVKTTRINSLKSDLQADFEDIGLEGGNCEVTLEMLKFGLSSKQANKAMHLPCSHDHENDDDLIEPIKEPPDFEDIRLEDENICEANMDLLIFGQHGSKDFQKRFPSDKKTCSHPIGEKGKVSRDLRQVPRRGILRRCGPETGCVRVCKDLVEPRSFADGTKIFIPLTFD
jgi:hypothetical protein